MDTIIACSFHRAYAEHGSAQDRAMRQLAEAKPAGMAFATVDLQLVLYGWAGVRELFSLFHCRFSERQHFTNRRSQWIPYSGPANQIQAAV